MDLGKKLFKDAFKIKKTDLRTLSQKERGGPDQIPKFVAYEIGTLGRESSQTLICPIFKYDLRIPLQAIRLCYLSLSEFKSLAIQPKMFSMYQILIGVRGSEVKHKYPKCCCPKVAMERGGGGGSDPIGTMSLNPFFLKAFLVQESS